MLSTVSPDMLLECLFEGVYFVDKERQIAFWNAGAERIAGFSRAEVIGSCCADNLLCHISGEGTELCLNGCPLAATMEDGQQRESRVFLRHKLGHRVPILVRTSPVRDAEGNVVGAVEVFSDNSSSMQILQEYEKLKKEVYLDQLTGVGNRRYGEMTLVNRLFNLATNGFPFSVLFMDIDHFKRFNDEFGHRTGDQLLTMVARSVALCLRKVDVVARWGGEEFVAILPGAAGEVLAMVAERVRAVVEKSFVMVNGERVSVTVSIGATVARSDDDLESVVHRADELMYRSKNGGRNRVTMDWPPQ
ncbi:GGDEF domain-containing protein [Geomonas sp. Red32]|uniref:GGDEF domain-containing protein n=1 Tax=Geomonas sp. Red32 TaxID=2912856 RepID=UPI00202CE0E8|nr:GGDEF domain-containing protein [Geomonas sp. Red32]MCM0080501.1 GGDEF domain-containing protein [Geomonas sp. Red32]